MNRQFTATVTAVNDAPTITSTVDSTANEDELYSYTITASDVDGNTLTYAAPTIPSWLSFNASTRVLSGTPLNANVGDTTVVLTVTDDGEGTLQDSQTFTISVSNTNDTPVLLEIANPDTVLEDGENIVLTIAPTDEDAGASLEVSVIAIDGSLFPDSVITVSPATGGSGDVRTITMNPPDNQNGESLVTVYVNDGTV